MFKDLSIKNKLYLGFGSIVAIILILLGMAYNSFSRLSQANAWDRHTMEVLVEIDKIHNYILQIQVDVRGFILTGVIKPLRSKPNWTGSRPTSRRSTPNWRRLVWRTIRAGQRGTTSKLPMRRSVSRRASGIGA